MKCVSPRKWSLKAVDSLRCSAAREFVVIGTMSLTSPDTGNEC